MSRIEASPFSTTSTAVCDSTPASKADTIVLGNDAGVAASHYRVSTSTYMSSGSGSGADSSSSRSSISSGNGGCELFGGPLPTRASVHANTDTRLDGSASSSASSVVTTSTFPYSAGSLSAASVQSATSHHSSNPHLASSASGTANQRPSLTLNTNSGAKIKTGRSVKRDSRSCISPLSPGTLDFSFSNHYAARQMAQASAQGRPATPACVVS